MADQELAIAQHGESAARSRVGARQEVEGTIEACGKRGRHGASLSAGPLMRKDAWSDATAHLAGYGRSRPSSRTDPPGHIVAPSLDEQCRDEALERTSQGCRSTRADAAAYPRHQGRRRYHPVRRGHRGLTPWRVSSPGPDGA